MIDTTSVEAFSISLPKIPKGVERILTLKMRQSDAISPATASLAQRGYLGCLPFAHTEADEIVLRLLPGRKLAESPVAIAWWSDTEGMTIAPDLSRFVAGRMAQMDVANPIYTFSEQQQQQLLEFASEFGDNSTVKKVLGVLDEVRLLEEAGQRMGALWNLTSPENHLCQALAKAWSLEDQELSNWLDIAILNLPEVEIVKRMYVTHNIVYKTGIDVTEIAWQLVMGDDVFDPNYNGLISGTIRGARDHEALVYAVKWLRSQERLSPELVQSNLWPAAQAFADAPSTYDGAAHFAAAQAIAAENPVLAYTYAANAAAYYVNATQQTPIQEIIFTHGLAVENDWKELRAVLEWTKFEMKL